MHLPAQQKLLAVSVEAVRIRLNEPSWDGIPIDKLDAKALLNRIAELLAHGVDLFVNRPYYPHVSIGHAIRTAREAGGQSLRALARVMSVDVSYLSRVERGLAPASSRLISSIASALGISEEQLLLHGGRVPETWQRAIDASPLEAVVGIRAALGRREPELRSTASKNVISVSGIRLVETDEFPFEQLSVIAEAESWRKEIHRPIYHLHKWWAQRLGSVFRALVISSFAPRGSDVMQMFYESVRIPGVLVFDPFMGSGTTVGETLKLGARAIGRDINPVAFFHVLNATRAHRSDTVIEAFERVVAEVEQGASRFYRCQHSGSVGDALYYFWVKVLPCPHCDHEIDLFSSYTFSWHAYPRRRPDAFAVCPQCGAICATRYDATQVACSCGLTFDPRNGPAKRTVAECPKCGGRFPIAERVRQLGGPPRQRMYAKIALGEGGRRHYSPADEFDVAVFEEAEAELKRHLDLFPVVKIEAGYNTDQAIGYGYRFWHEMFNARQLLVLGLLGRSISQVEDPHVRDLLICFLSGALEFHNVFTSFKGEGTGAVRHMFSHHILKPERTPFEANPLAAEASGSIRGLFKRRIVRAMAYKDNPLEIRVGANGDRNSGVGGLSDQLGFEVAESWDEFQGRNSRVYLSAGDSGATDLPGQCVDLVLTDPPFFDNVHYSELADFFYVWQRHWLDLKSTNDRMSTRHDREVQHGDADTFAARLGNVWRECRRVLNRDGLLIFTYHHSRHDGWRALLKALAAGDFGVVAAHPIKAEMSVASPKHQAKHPIDLDVVLVCRKREAAASPGSTEGLAALSEAMRVALDQIRRLNSTGRLLSINDVRIVVTSQMLRFMSWADDSDEGARQLEALEPRLNETIQTLHASQRALAARSTSAEQYSLL